MVVKGYVLDCSTTPVGSQGQKKVVGLIQVNVPSFSV